MSVIVQRDGTRRADPKAGPAGHAGLGIHGSHETGRPGAGRFLDLLHPVLDRLELFGERLGLGLKRRELLFPRP